MQPIETGWLCGIRQLRTSFSIILCEGDDMAKMVWILLFGVVIGIGVDRTLLGLIPTRPAQQQQGKQQAKGEGQKGDALPTMESLPEQESRTRHEIRRIGEGGS
jgi:hypothetical protein